jgi:2-iminoacetate synthase ThiH
VRLGHRLAQMSLGFGADELFGPIMPERALRLGANANNPVMTRKEAAMLIRGAGLAPFERTSSGALEEVQG